VIPVSLFWCVKTPLLLTTISYSIVNHKQNASNLHIITSAQYLNLQFQRSAVPFNSDAETTAISLHSNYKRWLNCYWWGSENRTGTLRIVLCELALHFVCTPPDECT